MWFPQQLFTSISLCGTRLENLEQGAKTSGVPHAYFSIFKSLNALIAAVLKALLG